jgi:hypothetical protein
MKVKKNMRSLWYFGGFSKMDFNCSFLQLKSPIGREDLYEKYSTLSRQDVLYFDYTENGTVCEIFYLNEGYGRTETLNTIETQFVPPPKPKPKNKAPTDLGPTVSTTTSLRANSLRTSGHVRTRATTGGKE